ncbi:MAG: hypothetical protein ACT4PP_10625 [Sporichthyaceae bacterium]
MTFGGEGPRSNRPVKTAKVKEVLETGFGRFDLRTPPSRAEAGMTDEGSDVGVYEVRGDKSFEVEVLLPGERTLRFVTDFAVFNAPGLFPTNAPPDELVMSHGGREPTEARDRLLALAEQFGLATQPILDWYAIAESGRVPINDAQPNTPFLSTKLGYLSLSVQGRFLPAGDPSDSCVVAISLYWGGKALRERRATTTPTAAP